MSIKSNFYQNGLKTSNRLDSNKFDFILNSVSSLYSNTEMTKILTIRDDDDNDDHKCDLEIVKCGMKVLEHLVVNQQHDGFVAFFLNSIRSFHKSHRCSTKTAICFSIFLWKRICESELFLWPSSEPVDFLGKFHIYLNKLLDRAIQLVKSNDQLTVKLDNENLKK